MLHNHQLTATVLAGPSQSDYLGEGGSTRTLPLHLQ